jgi:protein SCO1/2
MRAPGAAALLAAAALTAATRTPAAAPAARTGRLPPAPPAVSLEEHIGAAVPRDLVLIDEAGRAAPLGERFGHGRPVVLVLAYYRCPMLCDLVLRGLAQSLERIRYVPGRELDAITVSIDPKDTPAAAARKQAHVLQALGHPEAGRGWPFLVGAAEDTRRLADAVGFHYTYDPKSDQFAHPAVAVVLTPDGRIARYLYGVAFRPFDVRMALTEAGRGQLGGVVERLLLTCFRYDPSARRYGPFVLGMLKVSGAVVLATLGLCLFLLWRMERSRAREVEGARPPEKDGPGRW